MIGCVNAVRHSRIFSGRAVTAHFHASQSAVEEVREYIRNQREHHKRVSFQDEFRAFLKRYEVEFDEKYVWD